MSKSASMYIRIDPTVKTEVEAIYSQYGMSITDAINVFLYQSRNVGGLPFDLRPSIPNAKTIAAMKEADLITSDPSAKKYADLSEIITEVQDEI
jgi:DNA-damage-inducible protein J